MWKIFKREEKIEQLEKYTGEDKEKALKAAYALNLCTVSISQIIEYNDLGFMEREYEAILNNLNLEAMPKDEALLKILKQLLDVISYFRIEDGERKMMEKEYEQRVKNAIWSAVPNPSMIVTSGSPIGIAISLASQIGIGYMNYRKEKAKIQLDKERQEWELQKSAMEQFHGLRRELFDTAWRLADEYQFKDEYRITERQISQYNRILLDNDDLRRYERLEYISDKFQAYPPFIYYLGSAANAVYMDEGYSPNMRIEYRNRAISHFKHFLALTENNLLREDQLVASCALEMFDLIEEKGEQLKLLDRAIKSSGNAFDVLQICAMSYLKIGEMDSACRMLKMLVNEGYNIDLNSQLLSKVYVSDFIAGKERYKDEYMMLMQRTLRPQRLYPLPDSIPQTEEEKEELSILFLKQQQANLLNDFTSAIESYIRKKEREFKHICKLQGDISSEMAGLIKTMGSRVESLSDDAGKISFLARVKEAIEKERFFQSFLSQGHERSQGRYNIKFADIFEEAFIPVVQGIRARIMDAKDMSDISNLETVLYKFSDVNYTGSTPLGEYSLVEENAIEEILGNNFAEKYEEGMIVQKCMNLIKREGSVQEILLTNNPKIEILLRRDAKFEPYIERNRNTLSKGIEEKKILAIINSRAWSDIDLIITTEKIFATGHFRILGETSLKNAKLDKSGKKLQIGKYKYSNENVDLIKVTELIEMLAEVSGNATSKDEMTMADKMGEILITNIV